VQVTAYGQQTVPAKNVVRSCDPLKIFGAPIMQTDRFSRFKKIIIPYIIYKVINLISVRTYSKTVHNITRTK